jgi:predicted metalloprotease
VAAHENAIATAQPKIPDQLNDRAADIWEPLLVLADIAGGDWPAKARHAAIALSTRAQETNPIGALLMDIFMCFANHRIDRVHTRELVGYLDTCGIRPWNEMLKRPITDLWLSQQLRPYAIRPRTFRVDGIQAKGYLQEDMLDAFRRYIPRSEVERIHQEFEAEKEEPTPEPAAA